MTSLPPASGYDDKDMQELVELIGDVRDETLIAMRSFPPFNSAHEGWAVIHEELDELWAHVKGNTGESSAARQEAVQIAAMALRYVVDLYYEPLNVEPEMQVGYERDTFGSHPAGAFRWWLYVLVPGSRNQAARRGVIDRGFRFARGGRAYTEDDARREIARAQGTAEREMSYWNAQPSHALGPHGELIALDEVAAWDEQRRIDA